MARPRSRRRYPRDLNAVLKALDVRVACPRCGQPGSLRIVAHGYLAVRHGAKSTHIVPQELEANVMAALADRLAEAARKILHAAEELKGPTQ